MAGSNLQMDTLNVYLIGNNPIELGDVHEKLRSVKEVNYVAEIGFEIRHLIRKVSKFNPACILIDDNLGQHQFAQLMKKLADNRVTRNIPIAILKSSNREFLINKADDFVLKQSLTADRLSKSIRNSIRLRKMKVALTRQYKSKKKSLISWAN